MPTPLPSEGTVLQTAEFADSLYSPLFVSLLYHILTHLSRGFFNFFRWGGWDSNPQYHLLASGGCPFKPTTPKGKRLLYPAYPRHFFSLRGLVHICIPHTGTPCGRVIGNKVLLALVGTHLFVVALPSPFVPLLYHTLRRLSRGFLNFFCSVGRFGFTSPNYALGRGCSLLSASLHPYCIILWGICQVLYFSEKILDENLGVFAAWRFSFLLASIIPLKAWVVKGFQKISFLLFESTEQPHAQAMSLLPFGVGVLTSP